jgi:SNF2 family DNA or RNA helicase
MELRPYQKEGVCRLVKGSCLLLDEMGTGKTVQTAVALRYLQPDRVLIVCPLSMVNVWLEELAKWYPREGFTRWSQTSACTGPARLVTNFERIPADQSFDILVVDEAHKIKNRKAQRSLLCRKVARQSRATWLLTGTPILNRADEMWHLLHLVDRKRFSSYWKFVTEWCEQRSSRWSKSGIEILPGVPQHKQKGFARMLEPYIMRRTKADVKLELPKVTRQVHWLDMEKTQAQLHKDILHELKVDIEDGKTLTVANLLARTLYARRCAVSPLLMGGQGEGSKFWALAELLEGLEGSKVVVFSQWTEPLFRYAEKHCSAGHYWFYHGGMSERGRKLDLEAWRKASCGTLFATIGAGGVGLTLTEANTAIIMDEPWVPAETDQAIARLDRIGQKEPVTVHFLRCRNSIEEWVCDKVGNKRAMIAAIEQAISQL